jgi:hypothetical protein
VHLGVGLRVRFQRGASLVRDCQLVTMADAAGRVFQISTLQVTAGSSPSFLVPASRRAGPRVARLACRLFSAFPK